MGRNVAPSRIDEVFPKEYEMYVSNTSYQIELLERIKTNLLNKVKEINGKILKLKGDGIKYKKIGTT